jgi:hypothetical protein
MAFTTFPGVPTQSPLQIIQYEGPPKPKRSSKQPPSEIPSHPERDDDEGLTPTSNKVKFVDLTWLGEHPSIPAAVKVILVVILALYND